MYRLLRNCGWNFKQYRKEKRKPSKILQQHKDFPSLCFAERKIRGKIFGLHGEGRREKESVLEEYRKVINKDSRDQKYQNI